MIIAIIIYYSSGIIIFHDFCNSQGVLVAPVAANKWVVMPMPELANQCNLLF